MTEQEALCLVDTLLQTANHRQRLNDVQSAVFLETWTGRSYREIAKQLGYEHDYIKQVGSYLWRNLSPQVGEKVSKRNIKTVLRRYQQAQASCSSSFMPVESPRLSSLQDLGEPLDVDKLLSVLVNTEVVAEVLPKEPLRELLEALKSLKQRSLD